MTLISDRVPLRADDSAGAWYSLHLPECPDGRFVVVCPGGGYMGLCDSYEGVEIASWLNARGIGAAVLRYRLAPRFRHPVPAQDALEMIRQVRLHASAWNAHPERVGIWGFSAGGHLAATTAIVADRIPGVQSAPDGQLRPNYAVLCYPVVAMTPPWGLVGSTQALLGESPDPDEAALLTLMDQVTAGTPPLFLFHTADDEVVPMENSLLLAMACRRAGVDVELHLYPNGPHGVGLAADRPGLSSWPSLLDTWLQRF